MKKLNNLIVHCASSIVHQSKTLTLLLVMLLSVDVWGEYKLVESSLSDWRGDYLIAYSSTVFMDGSLPGGATGCGKAQAHVSPGSALSGKTITSDWGDLHYVTIEAINDNNLSQGYVIKTHNESTPYFYQTSNKNGMVSTDNKNTAANYPITITFNSSSDISLALGGGASGAILHYNNATGSSGEMFRYYKNGGQQNIYLYKKEDAKTDVTLTPKQSSRNVDKDDMIEDLGSWFTIAPSAYDGTISYTSSNPSVFDVEDGVGFAYSAGTCSLYISASETTKYKAANCTISVTVNETCGNPITISKSPATLPSGCSFSLDKTSGCGDDAGESVLVTCLPATHYTVTAVNSTSGTPGPISSNQCTISGITDDALISVTFTEDTKYTVTFVDGVHGESVAPKSVYENETFTFPSITDKTAVAPTGDCVADHYHFIGWVEEGTTPTQSPSNVIAAGTNSITITKDITYKAVWAKEEL